MPPTGRHDGNAPQDPVTPTRKQLQETSGLVGVFRFSERTTPDRHNGIGCKHKGIRVP